MNLNELNFLAYLFKDLFGRGVWTIACVGNGFLIMPAVKLTPKLIESVVAEVSGPDVVPLIRALKNKKNVSEFAIADEIDTEINSTRNMLYRLYSMNLVSFTRKKDKKKGWYIYYWTFNVNRVKDVFLDLKVKRLEMLHERLDRERSSHFFLCPDRCIRLDFEQAADFGFKCPECGKLLTEDDNVKKISELEKELKVLEKELKSLKVSK